MAALNAAGTSMEVADGMAAALFDLYRGTGQQASFESLALECAQRFGRSAPGWFSTPQELGRERLPTPAAVIKKPATARRIWQCPAELDEADVLQLRAFIQDQPQPCCLDWGHLQTMTPRAAEQLSELMARWCDQVMRLCFDGQESLQLLLQACTPMGDSSVPSYWWQLRLDLLRLLRLPNEFEQVAIDFCVTYELSPPSWVPPGVSWWRHPPCRITSYRRVRRSVRRQKTFVVAGGAGLRHAGPHAAVHQIPGINR